MSLAWLDFTLGSGPLSGPRLWARRPRCHGPSLSPPGLLRPLFPDNTTLHAVHAVQSSDIDTRRHLSACTSQHRHPAAAPRRSCPQRPASLASLALRPPAFLDSTSCLVGHADHTPAGVASAGSAARLPGWPRLPPGRLSIDGDGIGDDMVLRLWLSLFLLY